MKAVHLFAFIAIVTLLQGCYKDPVANFEYSYEESMSQYDLQMIRENGTSIKLSDLSLL